MIGYDDIHWAIFAASCVGKRNEFEFVLKDIKIQPKIIVEVGTHKGHSTTILASISKRVYTFDIDWQAIAEPLWELLKVRDKIIYTIVGRKENRKWDDVPVQKGAIKDIDFYLKEHNICPDFVFLDGPHKHYVDVKRIFDTFVELGAKRILFDDAIERFPGTLQLAKEIKAKMFYDRFAYWERKED